MSDKHDTPILYRMAGKPFTMEEETYDHTILGTPVPVAHSTVSQVSMHKTFLTDIKQDRSAVPKPQSSTYSVQENPETPKEGNSVLNVDSIKGLSGSVLEQSLGVKPLWKMSRAPSTAVNDHQATSGTEVVQVLSVEEEEAENRNVQIDRMELQLLEDAFSDLGGFISDADECTVPTKACATWPDAVDSKITAAFRDDLNNGESGTTISSLTSTADSSKPNDEKGRILSNPSDEPKNNEVPVSALLNTPSIPDVTVPFKNLDFNPPSASVGNHLRKRFEGTINNLPVDLDETNLEPNVHSESEDKENIPKKVSSISGTKNAVPENSPSIKNAQLIAADTGCFPKQVHQPNSSGTGNAMDKSATRCSDSELPVAKSASAEVTIHTSSVSKEMLPGALSIKPTSLVTCSTEKSGEHNRQISNSPLLSNSSCLIFCGAVCAQTQHQQLLIKHQLAKPVNIHLVISTGDEVFKLVDERGYLFAGAHSVCLPPNLEYTVRVAYAARHPLSWDTGCLQLSMDCDRQSVWKVRLIGYTNSCQLECSCCTRLSSDVYWTTAVRVPSYSKPLEGRRSLTSSTISDKPLSADGSDVFVANVMLTNYGARSAWLFALAESLTTDSTSAMHELILETSGVSVHPNRLVIGPKQSQNLSITLKAGVNAARIVLFYGDEVLRHQVRLHYILPDGSPACERKYAHRRVRIADLMTTFTNESRLQMMEVPNQSLHPIRPADWHQALSKQLRLREHLVLNVYVTESESVLHKPNRNSRNSSECLDHRDHSRKISSIYVHKEAFVNSTISECEPKDSPGQKPCTLSSHHQKIDGIHDSMNGAHLFERLQLDPSQCLRFPKVAGNTIAKGKFNLRLIEPSVCQVKRTWLVVCSIRPISSVLKFNPKGFTFEPITISTTDEKPVFGFCPPNDSHVIRHDDQWRLCGLLASKCTNPLLDTLELPFRFCSSEIGLFRQHWHLIISLRLMPSRESLDENTVRCMWNEILETTAELTATRSFTIALEGQCEAIAGLMSTDHRRNSPLAPNRSLSPPLSSASPESQRHIIPQQRNGDTSRHSRRCKLGPLYIGGVPVTFRTIGGSPNDGLVSSSQIELFNDMKENTIFIHLDLPRPPFHLIKPSQTRFRILPKRLVRLTVTFQPTETGRSESVLKITVTVLPPTGLLLGNVSSDVKLRSYKAAIPLAGEMVS